MIDPLTHPRHFEFQVRYLPFQTLNARYGVVTSRGRRVVAWNVISLATLARPSAIAPNLRRPASRACVDGATLALVLRRL